MSQTDNNNPDKENQAKKRDLDRVTWFRHNIDAAQGRRFVMLHQAGGYKAHGIFWALVPYLYKYENKYPLANAKQKEALAYTLRISVEELDQFIQWCIECENLLTLSDGVLSCDRIADEFAYRSELSEKRRKAGTKGGQANAKQKGSKRFDTSKQNQAQDNTIQDNTIQNNTKKKKGESKLSLVPIASPPSKENPQLPDELQSWFREQGYEEAAPNVWLEPGTLEKIRKIPNFGPYVDEALELLYRWSISHDISPKTNKPGWYTYRQKRDHRATLINQIKRIKAQEAA